MINKTLNFNSREEFREYAKTVLKEELETLLLEAEGEMELSEPEEEIVKDNIRNTAKRLLGYKPGETIPEGIIPESIIEEVYEMLSDDDKSKILLGVSSSHVVNLSKVESYLRRNLPKKPPVQDAEAEQKELTPEEQVGHLGLERSFVDPGREGEFSRGGGETWNPEFGFKRRKRDFARVYSSIFGGEPIEKILTSEEVEALDQMGPDNYKKFADWVEKTKKAERENKPLPPKPVFVEKIFANVDVPTGQLQRFKPAINIPEPESRIAPFSSKALTFKQREPLEYKPLKPSEQEIPPVLIDPLLHKVRVDLSGAELAQYLKLLSDKSRIMNVVAKELLNSGIKPEEKRREVVVYDKDSGEEEYVDILEGLGADIIDVVAKFPGQLLRGKYKNLEDFLVKNKYSKEVIDIILAHEGKYRFEIEGIRAKPVKTKDIIAAEVEKEAAKEAEKTEYKRYPSQEAVSNILNIPRSTIAAIEDIATRKIDKLRNLTFNKIVKTRQLALADLVTEFMIDNDEFLSFPEDMNEEKIAEINEGMFRKFLEMLIDKDYVGQYLPDLIAEIPAFGFKKGQKFKDPKKLLRDIFLNVETLATSAEEFKGIAEALAKDIIRLQKEQKEKPSKERDKEIQKLNSERDALIIFGTLLSSSVLVEVIVSEYDAVKALYENALEATAQIKNAYEDADKELEEEGLDPRSKQYELMMDLIEKDFQKNFGERLSDAILDYLQKGEQGLYGLREKIHSDVKFLFEPKSEDAAHLAPYVATKRSQRRDVALEKETLRQAMEREGQEALGIRAYRKQREEEAKAGTAAKNILAGLLAKK